MPFGLPSLSSIAIVFGSATAASLGAAGTAWSAQPKENEIVLGRDTSLLEERLSKLKEKFKDFSDRIESTKTVVNDSANLAKSLEEKLVGVVNNQEEINKESMNIRTTADVLEQFVKFDERRAEGLLFSSQDIQNRLSGVEDQISENLIKSFSSENDSFEASSLVEQMGSRITEMFKKVEQELNEEITKKKEELEVYLNSKFEETRIDLDKELSKPIEDKLSWVEKEADNTKNYVSGVFY